MPLQVVLTVRELQGYSIIGRGICWTNRLYTSAIAGKYDLVYAYEAANPARPWKKYSTTAPDYLNDLKELGPEWGYWVRAKEDCVWPVP